MSARAIEKGMLPMNGLGHAGRAAVAGALALALSGCISFGSEPPESLLTLTPSETAPAGDAMRANSATAIAVQAPGAPRRISVNRVPVQIDDTNIAYLQNAVWVEKPTRLFQQLLAERIRANGARVVIDGDDPAVLGATQLRGTLREMGYDARTSSVIVRYDAVKDDGDNAVQTRRFEASVSGVAAEAGPVGRALNSAANDVAGQVAAWIAPR